MQAGLTHRWGRSLGGLGNPLQDSCLGTATDRGAWWATPGSQGCKESDTTEVTEHFPQATGKYICSLGVDTQLADTLILL